MEQSTHLSISSVSRTRQKRKRKDITGSEIKIGKDYDADLHQVTSKQKDIGTQADAQKRCRRSLRLHQLSHESLNENDYLLDFDTHLHIPFAATWDYWVHHQFSVTKVEVWAVANPARKFALDLPLRLVENGKGEFFHENFVEATVVQHIPFSVRFPYEKWIRGHKFYAITVPVQVHWDHPRIQPFCRYLEKQPTQTFMVQRNGNYTMKLKRDSVMNAFLHVRKGQQSSDFSYFEFAWFVWQQSFWAGMSVKNTRQSEFHFPLKHTNQAPRRIYTSIRTCEREHQVISQFVDSFRNRVFPQSRPNQKKKKFLDEVLKETKLSTSDVAFLILDFYWPYSFSKSTFTK